MFDPTVFDNLKVAMENAVYDLDNLDSRINITQRIDRLEMSVMSREFGVQFSLREQPGVTAELQLKMDLNNLAAEILEMEDQTPGCSLLLYFDMKIREIETQCSRIENILTDIWKPELRPAQTLSQIYGEKTSTYQNRIELRFSRQINEDQMEDISELLEHVLLTLMELNKV
ncbi:hypothetical protein LK13_21180 [Paenibacillus polymyxa]|uniref:hypothetical protein n=1 Tax=Paenibacillus polymyxa TaxID=1406 RepID=UPI00042EBD4A|nr:hypothetical protein [Paenibacillus polymyxa]AHM65380.1 group-specific protein [Paenibacillus polymyxa SQR-21]AIY10901.1 hypothetical protein LK13_21180 [Paenibacillus polymyxa]RGL32047.1 hypothetical protein DXC69_18145 [Paenibacillus polymyxa]UMR37381.1 hypothetical protein MJ749_08180 [Paenibacillus polymyxa]